MRNLNHAALGWKKSSRSAGNGNCVEVAHIARRTVGVRDSKDKATGPVLVFAPGAWRNFLQQAKQGRYDI